MPKDTDTITFRPMTSEDVGTVPIGHQGDEQEVRARIQDLGSSAILAFDATQHVGQLQFRRYAADTRSPKGLWDPLYWGEFSNEAPALPDRTLSIYCYHVGQLDDTDDRDARYQGRGIGLRLLDSFLEWAKQAGFEAVTAKATPVPRAVMAFMGGQPPKAYLARGFEVLSSVVDTELRDLVKDRQLVPADADLDSAARISYCVKFF